MNVRIHVVAEIRELLRTRASPHQFDDDVAGVLGRHCVRDELREETDRDGDRPVRRGRVDAREDVFRNLERQRVLARRDVGRQGVARDGAAGRVEAVGDRLRRLDEFAPAARARRERTAPSRRYGSLGRPRALASETILASAARVSRSAPLKVSES